MNARVMGTAADAGPTTATLPDTFTVAGALAAVRAGGHDVDDEQVATELNKPAPPPLAARVVLGIGIWVGAVLVAGLVRLVDDWLLDDAVRAAVGVISLALAGVISRQERWGDVRVHLAVIFVIVGEGCVITALPHKSEEILFGMFLLQASIVVLVNNPLTRFTSTGLSIFWLFVLGRELGGNNHLHAPIPDLVAACVLSVFVGLWLAQGRLMRTRLVGFLQPVGYGLAGGLMGVAGLNAGLESGGGRFEAYDLHGAVTAVYVVLLIVAATTLAAQTAQRQGRSAPWSALVLFGAVACLLGALTWRMPDLLLAPLLLVLGKARRERALYLLGLVTLAGGLIFTYANVDGSLLFKAGVLFAAGGLLLGARLLLVMIFGTDDDAPPASEPIALSSMNSVAVRAGSFFIDRQRTQAWGKRLGVALAVALAVGTPLSMAASKERIKETGELVLLPLAPRDPRSIMQGDYMVLRYTYPREVSQGGERTWPTNRWTGANAPSTWPSEGALRLTLGDNGVVELAEPETEAMGPLADNQARLKYRVRRGRVKIGAESFFFEEGQASAFSGARFGGLRVSSSGEAVLVGLYDSDAHELGGR